MMHAATNQHQQIKLIEDENRLRLALLLLNYIIITIIIDPSIKKNFSQQYSLLEFTPHYLVNSSAS